MHEKTGLTFINGASLLHSAVVRPTRLPRCGLARLYAPLAAKGIPTEPVCRVAARRSAATGARAANAVAPLVALLAAAWVGSRVLPRLTLSPGQGFRPRYGKAALAKADVEHRVWAEKSFGEPAPQPQGRPGGVTARPDATLGAATQPAEFFHGLPAAAEHREKERAATARRPPNTASPGLIRAAPRLMRTSARVRQSQAHGLSGALHAPLIPRPGPGAEHGQALIACCPALRDRADPGHGRPEQAGALPSGSGPQGTLKPGRSFLPPLRPEGAWIGAMYRKSPQTACSKKEAVGFCPRARLYGRAGAGQPTPVKMAWPNPGICWPAPVPGRGAALQTVFMPGAGLPQADLRGFAVPLPGSQALQAHSPAQQALARACASSRATRQAAQTPAGLRRFLIAPAVAAVAPRAGKAEASMPVRAAAVGPTAAASSLVDQNRAAALNGEGAQAARTTSSLALTTNFSFQLNGISDADLARRVITALESSKSDVERLLSEIVHNQMRVSYAG